VADADLSVYRTMMDVNFFGPLMMTKAVLPSMLARGEGKIVCTTSVAGKYGSPMRSGYHAAKHETHGFFDFLREEVAEAGIDVTLIVPGAVRTNV
jgi:NADP-dependent 3-hydroxy acid dehydrogenase YdfG